MLTTRPTLWNFKIRRMTFLNYIKIADLLNLRLLNCERASHYVLTG